MRDRFDVGTSAPFYFCRAFVEFRLSPISRDQGGNHDGYNVHGGIIDELHAHPTRAMFDVLETATGSRDQSLLWLITTAGFDRAGICYEQRRYVCRSAQAQSRR